MDHASSTGSPFIAFYQAGTRRSYIQHSDTNDDLIITSEYAGIMFRPGSSGTEFDAWLFNNSGHIIPQGTSGTRDIGSSGARVGKLWTDDINFSVQAGPSTIHDNGSKSANFTINWSNGMRQEVKLTGNVSITSFSNIKKGHTYVLDVLQDSTGGRTLGFPAAVDFGDGEETVDSTADNRTKYVFEATSTSKMDGFRAGTGFAALV